MSRHVIAGYFGTDPQYPRLARVLAHSAGVHCWAWERRIEHIAPTPLPRDGRSSASHLANTQKMAHWCAAVDALPDGAEAVLLDIDTLIVRPLDDVWDLPFDVAYTTKAGTRVPINTGVLFVRVSPASRAFLATWRDLQVAMLANGADEATRAWRSLMIGLNQAALAATLHELGLDPKSDTPALVDVALGPRRVHLCRLQCRDWNCEDASWPAFHPETTRIVHYKGHLRDVVLGRVPVVHPHVRALAELWAFYERMARHGQPA